MLPMYSRVELVTDKYLDEGARRGMIGFIIEVYDGGRKYDIEFSDATTGNTLALVIVGEEDIVLVPFAPRPDERRKLS